MRGDSRFALTSVQMLRIVRSERWGGTATTPSGGEMSIVGMGRLCGPRSLRHRWSRRSASTSLRCVAAAVMVASVVVAGPATAVAQGEGFSDVSEGVHTPAIDALAEKGVFEGTLCGEDMFCPTEPIKRSEMAVWLIRALEDDQLPAAGSTRFADVDADVWWAPYVERLAELEITVGCGREPLNYCPDTSVSRGQMATFLVRAFDLEAAGPAGFVDTEGSTHEANIDALAAAGITVGCTRDPLQFCTGDPVRRSQMATFLARALGLVETPRPHPQTQAPSRTPKTQATTHRLSHRGPAVAAAQRVQRHKRRHRAYLRAARQRHHRLLGRRHLRPEHHS